MSRYIPDQNEFLRKSNRYGLVLGVAILAGAGQLVCAQSNAPAMPAKFEGRIRTDFEYRSEGPYKDSDLYESWYGGARDLVRGKLDFYASGWSHQDFDRTSSSSQADNIFVGADDSATEDRLLQCYLDAHDQAGNMRVRAGRQYIDSSDYLHLDGVDGALFEKEKLGVGGYFGAPVSYYTSLSGDYAGGVWLQGRPWQGNRTRFTCAQYDADSGEQDNNYYIESQQQLTDAARFSAQASVLNDDFRMARGDFFYFAPGGGTDFYCGGSQWGSFDAKTRAYSPLYDVLGKQEPSTYGYAKVAQQLSPHWMLMPGISCRVAEGDDHTYANRSYNDYDLSLIYEPIKSVSASLSVDYWDVSGGDSFLGLSGEIRYRYKKIWELSAGTSYADYSYNSYSDISYTLNGGQTMIYENGTVSVEDPYSYTYFLRMKWNITRRLVMRLQGDIEDDSTSSDLAYRGRASIEVRL